METADAKDSPTATERPGVPLSGWGCESNVWSWERKCGRRVLAAVEGRGSFVRRVHCLYHGLREEAMKAKK